MKKLWIVNHWFNGKMFLFIDKLLRIFFLFAKKTKIAKDRIVKLIHTHTNTWCVYVSKNVVSTTLTIINKDLFVSVLWFKIKKTSRRGWCWQMNFLFLFVSFKGIAMHRNWFLFFFLFLSKNPSNSYNSKKFFFFFLLFLLLLLCEWRKKKKLHQKKSRKNNIIHWHWNILSLMDGDDDDDRCHN